MSAPPADTEIKPLRDQVNVITAKIGRLTDMAAESETPRPFLAQIEMLEHQRVKLADELARKESGREAAEVLGAISQILASLAGNLDTVDRDALKEYLTAFLEKIELCPTAGICQLHYKIATGNLVASPRGFEPRFIP